MLTLPHRFPKPIYVTKPFLPPLEEYVERLSEVWGSGWLTNKGKQHEELRAALSDYLGYPNLSLFSNATQGLMTACKALGVSGEVITTPFTFPATPHVISWINATPVFADIDPIRLTIDPQQIEALITPKTTAILGVHVYGVPCDVNVIDELAKRYGLKVIYDAAHAFGTTINGLPVGKFGDATVFSFHATKLFHTAEGGALVTPHTGLLEQIELLKNFGIKNEEEVVLPGINSKMNELQAALGCCVLQHLDQEISARTKIDNIYRSRFDSIDGISIQTMPEGVTNSLQYFVVRIDPETSLVNRDTLHNELKLFNIFTRKYFFPLCTDYKHYQQASRSENGLLHATKATNEVLALPFYGSMSEDDAHRICDSVICTIHR